MKNIFRKLTLYSVALAAVSFSSCSLEENNPAGFTKENLATSIEGYETLVNQCYFAMERYMRKKYRLLTTVQTEKDCRNRRCSQQGIMIRKEMRLNSRSNQVEPMRQRKRFS